MAFAIFASTFLTIFVAELGDKTQLATLAISGTSNKPLAVFIGSALALVVASLIGVIIGESFSKVIPEHYLQILAATGFLLIGVKLLVAKEED